VIEATGVFEACPSLVEIGDVWADPPSGYLTAKATRGEDGRLQGVEVIMGNGMVVGQEDQAFPRSNASSGI
jgi:hypothetical protein